MDQKILIVGGAGYVGSHAAKLLKKSGFEGVIFDNFSTGHKVNCRWGKAIDGDLLNPKDLAAAFKEVKPVAVMHFAALTAVGESVTSPKAFYRNNIVGTLNLLDQMVEAKCSNIIFSSSCAVYGLPEIVPITEKEIYKPINPYGFTKYAMERALLDYGKAYGIRSVALRYFNASGADPDLETGELHEPETHLIPIVLEVAAGKRQQMTVNGTNYETKDGSCIRDYIHVMDLASAHVGAVKYLLDGKQSVGLNLGVGRGFSVLEVLKCAEKITGKKINYTVGARREGDPPVLVADSSLAQKTLSWSPQYCDLEVIIKHAWDWFKKMSTGLSS